MQYKTIEQVPDKTVERATAFMGAVTRLSTSRTAARIAQYIVADCLLKGQCDLPHKEFERRTGSGRRTIQRAVAALVKNKLIERIGETERGQSIYCCIWERADEHIEWGKQFDRDWDDAKKSLRLKHFIAPAYPYPAVNGHAQA